MTELLKQINRHLEFLMDYTIEPRSVRISTQKLIDEINAITDKPLSNGDRIRKMTDEELALMIEECCRCEYCSQHKSVCDYECYSHILEWLKQEVKEDVEH